MLNTMNFDVNVDIEMKTIDATVDIEFNEPKKSLEFGLNKLLHIDSISSDTKILEYDIEDNYQLQFRYECKKIILKSLEDVDKIVVKYSGSIDGWLNCITKGLVALNFYSVWYPMFSGYEECERSVTIKGLNDFTIVKGKKMNDYWFYKSSDFDCNIIGVRDWQIKSRKFMDMDINIYYNKMDVETNEKANMLIDGFSSILDYYINLLKLESFQSESFDIMINDDSKSEGGYCRENLIVLSEISNDKIYIEHFLAHELAHVWSKGADFLIWEDWLNETFAESMALLYIRETYGEEEYGNIINRIKERAVNFPAIKTKDGSRPVGVHDKGVYLMHRLTEKYGAEILKQIIRLFIGLEVKTTKNLLDLIKENISAEVANYIEENLEK